MYLIEELWIIYRISGVTLVNQRVKDKVDGDLFGGFISAVQNMLQGMGADTFDHMEMGNVQILIISDDEGKLFFICRSPLVARKDIIQNYLTEIKDDFCKKYEKYLWRWDGDLSNFDDVETIINIKDDPRNII